MKRLSILLICIIIMVSLTACDSMEIISPAKVFVNTLLSNFLVTHTGFEPMLTA